MSEQLRLARSRGHVVDTIYMDAEKCLKNLRGVFDGVHVNIAGADQLVPVAEARIKLIKNVCRALKAGLPWNITPSKLMHVVRHLNSCISCSMQMEN